MKTWDAVYQEWETDDGQIHAQRMGLLIRCKDCAKRTFTKCPMAIGRQSDYDFCSRAERKKE